MQAEIEFQRKVLDTLDCLITGIPPGYIQPKMEIEHMNASLTWTGAYNADTHLYDRLQIFAEPDGVIAIYTQYGVYRGRINLLDVSRSWYHEQLKPFKGESHES